MNCKQKEMKRDVSANALSGVMLLPGSGAQIIFQSAPQVFTLQLMSIVS